MSVCSVGKDLYNPNYLWDERCLGDFTLLGKINRMGMEYSAPKGIDKLDAKIIGLFKNCGEAIQNYSKLYGKIELLGQNTPAQLNQIASHEEKRQALIRELPQSINKVVWAMKDLEDNLSEDKRKEYYEALTRKKGWFNAISYEKPFSRDIREGQKQLGEAAGECRELFEGRLVAYNSDVSDWLARSHGNAKYANQLLEFCNRPIEANLSELQMLHGYDPQFYRDRSLHFQQKLIDRGELKAANAFASEWIRNLHADAPWEDVEAMGYLFLQTKEDGKLLDHAGFVQGLKLWMKQGVPKGNSEAATDQQNRSEILLSRLHLLGMDMSLDALNHYANAAQLNPEDPGHNLGIAFFYASAGEDTQEHNAKLTEEYKKMVKEFGAEEKYKALFYGTDIASWAITDLVIPYFQKDAVPGSKKERALQALRVGTQVAANEFFKSLWAPACIQDGECITESLLEATRLGASFSLAQIALPIVLPPLLEWIEPNRDQRDAFLDNVYRFGVPSMGLLKTAGSIALKGENWVQSSLSLFPTTASFGARTALYLGDEYFEPTAKGALLTTDRVASFISRSCLVACAGQRVMEMAAKKLIIRCIAKKSITSLTGYYIGNAVLGSAPFLAVVTTVGSVVYGIWCDFPEARTFALLNQVTTLCSKGYYLEGKALIKSAENWGDWSNKGLIDKYADCIPFFERVLQLKETEDDKKWTENVQSVDEALKILKEGGSYYSSLAEGLIYHKVVGYLNTGKIDAAMEILKGVDANSPVHGLVVRFVIEKAISFKSINECRNYIKSRQDLFSIPEYRDIIEKYQEYLAAQQGVGKEQIHKDLLQLVVKIPSLERIAQILYFEGIQHSMATENGSRAAKLLNNANSLTQAQLAENICKEAELFCNRNEYDQAIAHLEKAIAVKSYVYRPMLLAYLSLIKLEKQKPQLSEHDSEEDIHARIAAINSVIAASSEDAQIRSRLLNKKFLLSIDTKNYTKASEALENISDTEQVRLIPYLLIHHISRLPQGDVRAGTDRICDSLNSLKHKDLLKKFAKLVALDARSADPELWKQAANVVVETVKDNQEWLGILLDVRERQFFFCLQREQFEQAANIFNQPEIPPQFRIEMKEVIVNALISTPPDAAAIRKIARLFSIDRRPQIEQLVELDELFSSKKSPVSQKDRVFFLLDSLMNSVNRPCSWMLKKKCDLYSAIGMTSLFDERNSEKASQAFSEAEITLMELGGHEVELGHIRQLKAKCKNS